MQLTRRMVTYLIGSDRPLSLVGGFALFISMAGSPFLTPLYTMSIVVGNLVDNRQQFLVWASLISVFLIGVALSYVVVQVLRGKISDFHVSQQSQRHMPFIVAVCSSIVGVGVLWWMEAPWILMALASAFVMQGIFFGVLTRYRKISMHVAVMASCITALVLLLGWVAVPLIGFLPLQGWARVYRGRHTLGQVIAGALLAPLFTILILIPWWLVGKFG
jgi:membrane-associated phospholipid phosphatase